MALWIEQTESEQDDNNNSELEQSPVLKWATLVIDKGREKGFSDETIKGWIKTWGRSRNYPSSTITSVLLANGIKAYNRRYPGNKPQLVTCPKCGTFGIVNVAGTCADGETRYLVMHGRMSGFWGHGESQRPRRRRCYIERKDNEYIKREVAVYEKRDWAPRWLSE